MRNLETTGIKIVIGISFTCIAAVLVTLFFHFWYTGEIDSASTQKTIIDAWVAERGGKNTEDPITRISIPLMKSLLRFSPETIAESKDDLKLFLGLSGRGGKFAFLKEPANQTNQLRDWSEPYFDFFKDKKNREILIALDRGAPAPDISIPRWSTYWKWWALIFGIALSLGATIGYASDSLDQTESLFSGPWNRPGWIPIYAFMFPTLVFLLAIEGVIRVPIFAAKFIARGRHPRADAESQSLSPSPDEQRRADAKEIIQQALADIEQSKIRFVERRQTLIEQQTGKLEAQLENNRKELETVGEEITRRQRTWAESQRELAEWKENLEAVRAKTRENYAQEFEAIRNLAGVRAVQIRDNILSVYTDTIYIPYRGVRYEIGMLVILINLTHVRLFKVKNLTSTHPQLAVHPYGFAGSICFGNLSGAIDVEIYKGNYAIALTHILLALQSAEGDRPNRVTEWRAA